MNDKKILITGGLGFIGSYIADELIDENEVLIIDNKSTGKVENLQNINHENLTLIYPETLYYINDTGTFIRVIFYTYRTTVQSLISLPHHHYEALPSESGDKNWRRYPNLRYVARRCKCARQA